MSDFKATGGCLCGGVKYQYTSRPSQMGACHCSICRKVLGAPYGVFITVDYPSHFQLIKSDTLRHYKSSQIVERSFCGNCGGGVFHKINLTPDKIYVNAGSVDGDPGVDLQMHIFVKSKAPYVTINDGLPTFDEYPA
uniref:Glutathione-dependent formaldehyde-activating protein n=1 Tax=Scolopendra viridis TaxID=118503 RepID=A0A4D5R8W5_SCOVI